MRAFPTISPLLLSACVLLSACSDHGAPTATQVTPLGARFARGVDRASFTSLLVPGATGTLPLDINDHGVIVGRYGSAGRTHGFLRDAAGVYTTIDFPGANFTVAAGLNDSGVVVGWYTFPAAPTVRHGFVLKEGLFTSFDPPGSTFTNVLGINARGDISGRFCTLALCRVPGSGDFHGFFLHGGAFTTIDVPGAHETNAFKVNARGAIVGGFGDVSGGERLFVLRSDAFTTFALPNGKPITQDNGGMNARGDIVGTYCDVALPCVIGVTGTHGFFLSDGELTPIDFPGALATAAAAVNARGDIVGGYVNASGQSRGFLLSSHPAAF